jgi:hypothetical protein
MYLCRRCNKMATEDGRVEHWHTHNPGRCASRAAVDALFSSAELEQAHAEALEEDAAHDAAAATALELTVETLRRFADRPRTMPRTLRNRLNHQRTMGLAVPPWRHA